MLIGYLLYSYGGRAARAASGAVLDAGCAQVVEDGAGAPGQPGLRELLGRLQAEDVVVVPQLGGLGRSLAGVVLATTGRHRCATDRDYGRCRSRAWAACSQCSTAWRMLTSRCQRSAIIGLTPPASNADFLVNLTAAAVGVGRGHPVHAATAQPGPLPDNAVSGTS